MNDNHAACAARYGFGFSLIDVPFEANDTQSPAVSSFAAGGASVALNAPCIGVAALAADLSLLHSTEVAQ